MRRTLLIICTVLAAAAAGGGIAGLPGPWPWLSLAAAGTAAVLLFLRTAEPEPVAPARPARPTASRSTPSQHDADDSRDLQALRIELEKHKQLERELVSAKQAAEAAMMSKGEFLATMSHEIRTPLNGIIPLLDILLGSPLQTDQREYVRTAYQSARQLLRIVDDILDYSKLEANKLTLETVGLNLRELLDAVMRLMEKQAEAKSLSLSMVLDPSVRLAVRGDPVRLRQILTNLLSNAIKFTERGRVSLKVSRLGETHDSHRLRFEVHDTGIGLSAVAQAQLFQPFSQADASTTRTFGGTGLGLVICKRIVDLMGGSIGVESSEGRGSTFWFEVPVLKAVGDISQRRRELNGARCLVLSADPAMQRRLTGALPGWGVTPIQATTTQEALAKLRAAGARSQSWAFDVLIADLGSIRTTAVALQRSVVREAALAQLRLLWLEDDSGNPVQIESDARMRFIARNSSDVELRQSLTALVETDEPATKGTGQASSPEADSDDLPLPVAGMKLAGHVLLVEDNPVNRQVAQRLLTLSGLTLDAAENGKEALEKMQTGGYKAVLMDCQMPVMDGYTATRKRRESEQRQGLPRIPIIAMTANAMVGDREKCLQAGMDDYLSKPLNRALLERTLHHWLQGASEPLVGSENAGTVENTDPPPTGDRRPTLVAVSGASSSADAASSRADSNGAATAQPVSTPMATPPAPAVHAAVPASGEPPLDDEIVSDLREIMGAEFLSLVNVFLEDAPKAILQLEAAAIANDFDALVGPAHSLKSTSANLGALKLSELAKTVEHGSRKGSLDRPTDVVSALAGEFGRVQAALQETLRDAP
ncbi:MAG: ATP-binding protein [Lysobacteraceae bacterium]